MSRRTISEVCEDLDVSYPKLIKEFDNLDEPLEDLQEVTLTANAQPINLMFDATFFGREYGFLILCDRSRVLYFKEIATESVKHFCEGIKALKEANYRIVSVTVGWQKRLY